MKKQSIPQNMLAPCGITCAVCYVHLKAKNPCPGCQQQDKNKPQHCRTCKIKICASDHKVRYCFECSVFPCAIIKRLDQSYRQRYQTSLIENSERMKSIGIEKHLIEEKEKWTCTHCGGMISLHDAYCSECKMERS